MATQIFTADPKRNITFTFGDKTFVCSQVSAANLLDLQEKLSKAHPGARIHVMQACNNKGVRLSAGTHDYDAVFDISCSGITWEELQRFCRAHGWAAWWRHTGSWSSPSSFHVHMISLAAVKAGCKVGKYIDGGRSLGTPGNSSQVADYYNHALGLAGQHDSGDDHTWHPANIDATVFDYKAWLKKQEDDMPYQDWPKADKQALVDDVVSGILNAKVGPADDLTPVRLALYRASNVPDLIRAKSKSAVSSIVAKLTGKNA